MKICIDNDIIVKYPALKLGYVVAKNMNNVGDYSALMKLTRDLNEQIREKYKDSQELNSLPLIKIWQDIYRDMKTKPSKYRPTVEALMRRVLRGEEIPQINKGVNAYILAELQTLLPIGGYDLDRVSEMISLRYSRGGETFTGIDGSEEITYDGEIVYSDSDSILTRRWNYRDCMRTQITESSRTILLLSESPYNELNETNLLAAMKMTADYLEKFCNASVVAGVINVINQESFYLE